MIIACAFNTSGLMPISGLLLLIVSFFYNPAKIILNIKAIPLEIKLINLWALWAFITGIVVSINFDVFLTQFLNFLSLLLSINLIYLIYKYDSQIIYFFFIAVFLTGIIQIMGINYGFQSDEFLLKEREYGLENNPNSLGLKMVYPHLH